MYGVSGKGATELLLSGKALCAAYTWDLFLSNFCKVCPLHVQCHLTTVRLKKFGGQVGIPKDPLLW